jgi:hypothetical protein
MEHLGAARFRLIDAPDRAALRRRAGITLGRADHGKRGLAGEARRRRVGQAALRVASSSSSRSLSSRIISTWHSGSPKRALYSISLGPSAVSIRPAKRMPE